MKEVIGLRISRQDGLANACRMNKAMSDQFKTILEKQTVFFK